MTSPKKVGRQESAVNDDRQQTKGTILLASRRAEVQADIGSRLTAAGYEYETASVEDAASKVAERKFSSAVLDLESGASECCEALVRIRSAMPSEMMPVICLSSKTNESHRFLLTGLGATDVLRLPGKDLIGRLETAPRESSVKPLIHGSIETLAVVEVLQMLIHRGMSGVLRVDSAGSSGVLRLSDGKIVEARMAATVGEEAALEVARLNTGRFSFCPSSATDRPSGSSSGIAMSLENLMARLAELSAREPREVAESSGLLTETPPLEPESESEPDSEPEPEPIKSIVVPVAGPEAVEKKPRSAGRNRRVLARVAVALSLVAALSFTTYWTSGARSASREQPKLEPVELASASEASGRVAPAAQGTQRKKAASTSPPAPSSSAARRPPERQPDADQVASVTAHSASDQAGSDPPVHSPVTAAAPSEAASAPLEVAAGPSEEVTTVSSKQEATTEPAATGGSPGVSPAWRSPDAYQPSERSKGAPGSMAPEPVVQPQNEAPITRLPAEEDPAAVDAVEPAAEMPAGRMAVVASVSPPRRIDGEPLRLPTAMKRRLDRETIDLRVLVNAEGSVIQVEVLGEPPSFVARRAQKAAMMARFEPAREDGLAIEAWTNITLDVR